VRYKQTALACCGRDPAFFTMVISRCCSASWRNPTEDPGPVFYSARWSLDLFLHDRDERGMSLVTNAAFSQDLFPRIILPVAPRSHLVDFLIGSALFIGFIVYYKIPLG